jgi:hypothetical protein
MAKYSYQGASARRIRSKAVVGEERGLVVSDCEITRYRYFHCVLSYRDPEA